MIKQNLGYKLLALTAAVMLWAHVRNPNVTAELTLPLDVRKLEPALVVADKPKDIKVALEGLKEYVNSIAAEPDSVVPYVSLHQKKEGRHRLPVFVELPLRYTELVHTRADPPEVFVRVQRKAKRTFKVEVEFSRTPPVGFRFGTPRISPSRAAVVGIAAEVERVSRLAIAVDPGTSGPNSIDRDFTVMALDKNGRQIPRLEIKPEKVQLHLELEKAPASRVVFVSPSISGRPLFPHKVIDIDVQPQTVTLIGPAKQLMDISTVATEPLKLDDRAETFSRRVRVLAPSGTSLQDRTHVRVTVRIASPQSETTEGSGSEAENGS